MTASLDKNRLLSKTASGVFWTFLEQMGSRGVSVLVTILLARFLTPGDYGLIAMGSVVFAVANALMDVGFQQALIRKQDAGQADYATMFYTNIAFGLAVYAVLWLSAPAVASFYQEPRLAALVRIIGAVVPINSLQLVQRADLTRRLDFRTQFAVTVPAGIISGLTAVFLAMCGAGVWSLVAQMILSPLIITASLWRFNGWRPTLEFSGTSFRELFGFGSKIFLSGLLDILFRNIYVIVIAKLFSPTITGYYFFATKMRAIILEQFSTSIQKVSYPALASVQDDDARLKNAYRKLIQTTTYLVFPAMIFMGVTARPLFALLLNPKWLPAVPYLQLLCVTGLIYPLHVVNLNILKVKGRSDLFLYLEILKKITTALVLLVSTRYGIMAILAGQIITSILAYAPNSYFSAKLIQYPVTEQLRDVLPSFFAAAAAGAAALSLELVPVLQQSDCALLIFQGVIAVSTYIFAARMTGIEIQRTIASLLIERFDRIRGKRR